MTIKLYSFDLTKSKKGEIRSSTARLSAWTLKGNQSDSLSTDILIIAGADFCTLTSQSKWTVGWTGMNQAKWFVKLSFENCRDCLPFVFGVGNLLFSIGSSVTIKLLNLRLSYQLIFFSSGFLTFNHPAPLISGGELQANFESEQKQKSQ